MCVCMCARTHFEWNFIFPLADSVHFTDSCIHNGERNWWNACIMLGYVPSDAWWNHFYSNTHNSRSLQICRAQCTQSNSGAFEAWTTEKYSRNLRLIDCAHISIHKYFPFFHVKNLIQIHRISTFICCSFSPTRNQSEQYCVRLHVAHHLFARIQIEFNQKEKKHVNWIAWRAKSNWTNPFIVRYAKQ